MQRSLVVLVYGRQVGNASQSVGLPGTIVVVIVDEAVAYSVTSSQIAYSVVNRVMKLPWSDPHQTSSRLLVD